MSSITDPLGSLQWPAVSQDQARQAEAVLKSELRPIPTVGRVPDVYAHFCLGFNSAMAAIESHIDGKRVVDAVFVCREDLPEEILSPIFLAAASARVRLISLPKGARQRLSDFVNRDSSVIVACDSKLKLIPEVVEPISIPKLPWAYEPVELIPRKKNIRTSATKQD